MTSGPTHQKSRARRKKERRQAQRTSWQNDMILRGWVPIKRGASYGIYHAQEARLVERVWDVPDGVSSFPMLNMPRQPVPRWVIKTAASVNLLMTVEVAWNDIQRRWLEAMREAAVKRGWL